METHRSLSESIREAVRPIRPRDAIIVTNSVPAVQVHGVYKFESRGWSPENVIGKQAEVTVPDRPANQLAKIGFVDLGGSWPAEQLFALQIGNFQAEALKHHQLALTGDDGPLGTLDGFSKSVVRKPVQVLSDSSFDLGELP
jgi:hypothetical protein